MPLGRNQYMVTTTWCHMADESESPERKKIFIMTSSGLEEVSTKATDFSSLLTGKKIDTKEFLDALSEAIQELEKELNNSDE